MPPPNMMMGNYDGNYGPPPMAYPPPPPLQQLNPLAPAFPPYQPVPSSDYILAIVKEPRKIFLQGFPTKAPADEIQAYIAHHATDPPGQDPSAVESLFFPTHADSVRRRGHALAVLKGVDMARRCIEVLRGTVFRGRKLGVRLAHEGVDTWRWRSRVEVEAESAAQADVQNLDLTSGGKGSSSSEGGGGVRVPAGIAAEGERGGGGGSSSTTLRLKPSYPSRLSIIEGGTTSTGAGDGSGGGSGRGSSDDGSSRRSHTSSTASGTVTAAATGSRTPMVVDGSPISLRSSSIESQLSELALERDEGAEGGRGRRGRDRDKKGKGKGREREEG